MCLQIYVGLVSVIKDVRVVDMPTLSKRFCADSYSDNSGGGLQFKNS